MLDLAPDRSRKDTRMLLATLALSLPLPVSLPAKPAHRAVVIANRGSGDISVLDPATDTVAMTVPLPAGPNAPEPMYVFDGKAKNRVFVGDRANDRIVVFKSPGYHVEATVDVGAGVFHMWGDRRNGNLWVSCDIDDTLSVVDMQHLRVVATVPLPADLVALGGHPHDVFVDPRGDRAWVTLVGVSGATDWVVGYDARTFTEVARAEVGGDPHVSYSRRAGKLYVPCQDSGQVFVLDPDDLSTSAVLDVPGAHGAILSRSGRLFYTANLPGGGADALWAIRTDDDTLVGAPSDTPFPVPHNLALTPRTRKLYVTHSGMTANQITVYAVSEDDPTPVYLTTVTVGTNPFGLAYVK